MQTTLILNLDDALREAALWEVDKPREEWLFGFPAELALLAGQVLNDAMLLVHSTAPLRIVHKHYLYTTLSGVRFIIKALQVNSVTDNTPVQDTR